jgi:hypothetical protein
MATINGTFNSLIAGTLSGTVATPGAPGVGVPAGGSAGQVLAKVDGVSYNTEWVNVTASAAWGTITGTLSAQSDLQSALDAKQSVSGMSAYLSKAGNLAGLTDLSVSRDNLNLGTLNTPVFAGVTAQGSGANVANLTPTSLTLTHATSGTFTIQPSQGIVFPDSTIQTTAFTASSLSGYAPLLSPAFTGNPTAPTPAFGDDDTSIATTAFVQAGLLGGTANARNLEVEVRNQTGSTIPAGSIVYISGATGNRPLITLAQANNDANSAQTMGFTKTSIANNGTGYVIVRGELENIDTSALAEGAQLYLSPTTPGTWTTTKPSAPQHLVYVGIVVRAHPTLGTILVAVQNGYEIEELHNVKITSVANGQVLKYDSAQSLWVNGTDSSGVAWGAITGTLSSQTDLQSALNAKANLSGATFTGKVNFSPVAGVAGLNVGIGGTSAASTTAGDLWIATGGVNLNFRDGTGAWRVCAVTTSTNSFSSPQIIDTTATTAGLRITQKGTGNAIEVEDSTTPDSTKFVVDQFGKVGVGVTPDATAALNVDVNGVKVTDGSNASTSVTPGVINLQNLVAYNSGIYFADGSFQTTAATSGISDAPADGVVYGRQNNAWTSTDSLYYGIGNPSGFITDAPADGNYYVRKDNLWVQCTVVSIYDSNTSTSYNCLTV